MLGVLLESKASAQRRTVGATLSVAAHAAVIVGAVVATAEGRPTPVERVKPITYVVTPPPRPRDPRPAQPRTSAVRAAAIAADVVIRHIDAPTLTPTTLPPIDLTGAVAADSVVIGGGAAPGGSFGAAYGAADPGDSRDWDVREILTHVITPARPRYPEALRSAGVDGRVLVQFVVDTTGRVDPASVTVLASTHDLFTRAVREALANFRFVPAQAGGRRVSALAQMPFEFHVTR